LREKKVVEPYSIESVKAKPTNKKRKESPVVIDLIEKKSVTKTKQPKKRKNDTYGDPDDYFDQPASYSEDTSYYSKYM
jgi:hypothetical protein